MSDLDPIITHTASFELPLEVAPYKIPKFFLSRPVTSNASKFKEAYNAAMDELIAMVEDKAIAYAEAVGCPPPITTRNPIKSKKPPVTEKVSTDSDNKAFRDQAAKNITREAAAEECPLCGGSGSPDGGDTKDPIPCAACGGTGKVAQPSPQEVTAARENVAKRVEQAKAANAAREGANKTPQDQGAQPDSVGSGAGAPAPASEKVQPGPQGKAHKPRAKRAPMIDSPPSGPIRNVDGSLWVPGPHQDAPPSPPLPNYAATDEDLPEFKETTVTTLPEAQQALAAAVEGAPMTSQPHSLSSEGTTGVARSPVTQPVTGENLDQAATLLALSERIAKLRKMEPPDARGVVQQYIQGWTGIGAWKKSPQPEYVIPIKFLSGIISLAEARDAEAVMALKNPFEAGRTSRKSFEQLSAVTFNLPSPVAELAHEVAASRYPVLASDLIEVMGGNQTMERLKELMG